MGKTYKDNPNKWRKHTKPKPKQKPKTNLPEEKFDPYWNHH